MIRSRLCWLLGHRGLVHFGDVVQPERGVFVGPVSRRCLHCGCVLAGVEPQVGDRIAEDSVPRVMTAAQREAYLETGIAP